MHAPPFISSFVRRNDGTRRQSLLGAAHFALNKCTRQVLPGLPSSSGLLRFNITRLIRLLATPVVGLRLFCPPKGTGTWTDISEQGSWGSKSLAEDGVWKQCWTWLVSSTGYWTCNLEEGRWTRWQPLTTVSTPKERHNFRHRSNNCWRFSVVWIKFVIQYNAMASSVTLSRSSDGQWRKTKSYFIFWVILNLSEQSFFFVIRPAIQAKVLALFSI